eukprot:TRINITY_DN956_c0_g1_i10.p1 TRINITY_DN956_c0_g1~~TRINITY_DN956_c0_g1_i10.p1  ORF type:complete len:527 (-),score=66.17 TRINITY_DN956_c0_g1_i10:1253-2833(-)
MSSLTFTILYITSNALIRLSQSQPICDYVNNTCIQDESMVSELKSRSLPEFFGHSNCYLYFGQDQECQQEAPYCYYEADVFSINGVQIGQCYPNLTALELPQQEASECFKEGTIWKKYIPCVGYDSGSECNADQACQWYGGTCGPNNSTLTQQERQDMLQALLGLVEFGESQSDTSIVKQVRQSIVPNPTHFCDDVVPEILLCSVEGKALNSECGDVLSWYWEDEQDRQLFRDLEQCADPFKQVNELVCEARFQNFCSYDYNTGECSSNSDVTDYLLTQVALPSSSRQIMQKPLQCLLYGTDEQACISDGNCLFDTDFTNYFKPNVQGICDGLGYPSRERVAQAALQVGASCFSNSSDGSKIIQCISYPYNLCPEECIAEQDKKRCLPSDIDATIIDNATALNDILLQSLNTEVESNGFINVDYCEGEFLSMIDCVARQRDFQCGAKIVSGIFPNPSDQNLLNGTLQCSRYNRQPAECVPGSSPRIAQLKSAQEPAGNDGVSAFTSDIYSGVSLSLLVVILSFFIL